jgi:hypothetical protein
VTFYLVSALFKKVTLCRTLSRVSLVFVRPPSATAGAQQAARPGYTLPQSPVGDRSKPKRARRANEPMVQVAQKFAYPARYRVRNIPS